MYVYVHILLGNIVTNLRQLASTLGPKTEPRNQWDMQWYMLVISPMSCLHLRGFLDGPRSDHQRIFILSNGGCRLPPFFGKKYAHVFIGMCWCCLNWVHIKWQIACSESEVYVFAHLETGRSTLLRPKQVFHNGGPPLYPIHTSLKRLVGSAPVWTLTSARHQLKTHTWFRLSFPVLWISHKPLGQNGPKRLLKPGENHHFCWRCWVLHSS